MHNKRTRNFIPRGDYDCRVAEIIQRDDVSGINIRFEINDGEFRGQTVSEIFYSFKKLSNYVLKLFKVLPPSCSEDWDGTLQELEDSVCHAHIEVSSIRFDKPCHNFISYIYRPSGIE